MKKSQYLDDYLEENAQRGIGKGITVGTFLAYRLRGKANKFGDVYRRSLENSCERVGAVKGRSVNGGVAWYRVDSEKEK